MKKLRGVRRQRQINIFNTIITHYHCYNGDVSCYGRNWNFDYLQNLNP